MSKTGNKIENFTCNHGGVEEHKLPSWISGRYDTSNMQVQVCENTVAGCPWVEENGVCEIRKDVKGVGKRCQFLP